MISNKRIKVFLKSNVLTEGMYKYWKEKRQKRNEKNLFSYKGTFVNRSSGHQVLCVILAGYKEYLYPAVFGRLEKYMEECIDVCVITSGKYSETISQICEKNQWSYLSTVENNVSLVQNVAIKLHPLAQFIFKLDEDIFITKDFFSKMLTAYNHAKEGPYTPGLIAPLIPINGYGNYRILKLLNLLEDYEKKFERPCYESGPHRRIESDALAAEYMWKHVNIDEICERIEQNPCEELPCAIRFSIGAILFKRSLWEEMGCFSVDRSSNAMGKDEAEINSFCNLISRPVMVSENVVVGHFSFGSQTEHMKQVYEEEPELFF